MITGGVQYHAGDKALTGYLADGSRGNPAQGIWYAIKARA